MKVNYAPYSQEMIFLAALIGGFFLGLLWDFYRLLRYYIPINKLGTALGDILYWIVSLFFGLNIIVRVSWGNIRLFILLAFLMGAMMYFYVFSKIILKLCISIIDFVIQTIKRVYNIIIFPIKFIIKSLINFFIPYKIKIESKIKKCKNEIKFRINKLKHDAELKKKRRLKMKKLKKIMGEQRKNEKKFKKNRNASKKRQR